jgi:hypothetical protein
VSNRHQRRSDLRAFKRKAHREHLVTYLVAADDDVSLDHHPLLSCAVSFWRGNVEQRRPHCPACKANFADGAEVAMFLLSTPAVAASSASVTAFCECVNDLTIIEIEKIAAHVLRAVVPGGRWLDAR